MNEKLYDILIENMYFTHGIGLANNPETLNKFYSIIKLGGLYSKDKLKREFNYNVVGRFTGDIRMTSPKYISLFDPSLDNLRKKLLSDKIRQLTIKLNEITFLINRSVEYELKSERNYFDYSELMVEEHLPISYFEGIIIPKNSPFYKDIQAILKEYEIKLPIFDTDGELLNPVKGIKK